MKHTLVTFHAHPDDEAIATGGTIARAAAEGHRVVLVLATRGELGAVRDGLLEPGEAVGQRREAETQRAAEILGLARVEFLGYRDSGMVDTPANHDDGTFWSADLDEAAARLAAILTEERADVLTVYDEHGNYGHPDHIQVHRVGHAAARLARTPQVFEATMNRDHLIRMMKMAAALAPALDTPEAERPGPDDLDQLGTPEAALTTCVDVRAFVEQKRRAMAAHASQIDEGSFFLQLPHEVFREAFGHEWFIRRGAPPGLVETGLFEHL